MLPDDLKNGASGNGDSFHEGLDWPHAVGIIAALFVIAWAMDRIERRAEPPKPAIVEQPQLSHPLCGPDREQIVIQRGGGQAFTACVNADLRTTKEKK